MYLKLKEQVEFRGEKLDAYLAEYSTNNNTAIILVDPTDGETYAHATVNIIPLEKDKVTIKNYSENIGIEEALIEAGILGERLGHIPSGFIMAPIYKLSESVIKQLEEYLTESIVKQ